MLKRLYRRFERAMVGVAMTVMAFVLEKVVTKTAKKNGKVVGASEPSQIKAVGTSVEMPES